MALNPGDLAPNFSLPDAEGKLVSLADLKGQWVVLYFYPRDSTPGCTKEACGFRDAYSRYQSENIAVLGVSMDDAKSHQKFVAKYNLPFPLLSDVDAQVAIAYDSYGLKKFMGKEFMGIFRNTFLINPDGRIEKIYNKVKPEPHAEQVISDIALLSR